MILPLVGLITFEVFARRRRKKEYKLRLISALSVMDDQEALRLLSEVIENVKKTTEAHKPRFYNIYELTMASVGRISSHAKNENLRARFFYFQMLDAILEVRYNYVLQTRIKAA
jgi:recombinational DNA repair protein (RecF pathway)